MTDLMTSLIFVQLLDPGDQRAKDFNLTEENVHMFSSMSQAGSLKTFLSLSTCAVSETDTAYLQICLRIMKQTIEKSDAMLYAPSIDDINDNCKDMLLNCYMLELIMVLNEEEVTDKTANCIFEFTEELDFNSVGCLPCEAHSLQNITIFLGRLFELLEKMTAEGNM